MTTRWLTAALTTLLLAAPLAAQVRGPQGRRAELMERIHARFMEEIAGRLELDEAQADRVSEILRETMDRRRRLAREGQDLRQRVFAAVRDADTAPAELARLLDQMRELRRQEYELAVEEDRALADVLSVHQHAQLLVLRHRFNQRVQDIRGRMGGQRPPGAGGPPIGPPEPGGLGGIWPGAPPG